MNTAEILKNKYGSKYQNAKSFSGDKILLIEELKRIRSGNYKTLISQCREAFQTDKKKYRELK